MILTERSNIKTRMVLFNIYMYNIKWMKKEGSCEKKTEEKTTELEMIESTLTASSKLTKEKEYLSFCERNGSQR